MIPDAPELARLRRQLLRWYGRHARDLPWRRTPDPYRVWVSEIMLQQTTVAAVVPYFERFVARFPTVEDLAVANEQDVLKLWEGLGYYSRARNLHAAARKIVDDHRGTIPSDVAELERLPGIGRYTAGAIASLAYNCPAPIVEANTRRVYSRLLALRGDLRSSRLEKVIWNVAAHAVPKRSAGVFNQALMDLGATICTPLDPNCPQCPVRSCCRAFRDGIQREIPLSRRRPETTLVNQAMIAVCKRGRYLLRKGRDGERWAGLWEFLRVDFAADDPKQGPAGSRLAARAPWADEPNYGRAGRSALPTGRVTLSVGMRRNLDRSAKKAAGLTVEAHQEGFAIQHSVTRFRIRLLCATADWLAGALKPGAEFRWVATDDFHAQALSTPARKFADHLTRLDGA